MSTAFPDPQDRDPSEYWLAPARNFRTSARLHLQHFLQQRTVGGHLLDPELEGSLSKSQNLRVADLGCGNGTWMLELDSELSRRGISAQLDGYDINPAHFPPAAHVPPSVTFRQHDVLAQPQPADMTRVYDIVYVRGFVSLIANSNVTPLLSSVRALLKPGGWLQWVDARIDALVAESPSAGISKEACDTALEFMIRDANARGLRGEWLDVLDRHLEEHGFEGVRLRSDKKKRQDLKAWTENYLMLMEELHVLFPSEKVMPQAKMTREGWGDLFIKAVKKTEQGVVIHQQRIVTAVGRKAL